MNRCLVTGATGFLGRRVCAALQPRVVVRATSRTVAQDGPWHEAVRADLAAALPPSLLEGVDAVVHVAGTAHRHHARLDDDAAYHDVNVAGTRRLCAAASAAGVRRVVLASSVAVFGPTGSEPVAEDATPSPASAYGRSKLAAETIVRSTAAEPVVVRFPLLYGPGMPGNLDRMLRAVAYGRFPPVPRITNRRSMLHVDDAAAALAMTALAPRAAGRVYTATDGRAYSTYDIYAWTLAAVGRRPPRVAVPIGAFRALARAGDAARALTGRRAPFDSAAFRQMFENAEFVADSIVSELGFVASHRLDETLPDVVAALRVR